LFDHIAVRLGKFGAGLVGAGLVLVVSHDFDIMGVAPVISKVLMTLAGALEKPVWLVLPYVPDWWWLMEGDKCPWYPTMRLFRQTSPGDWGGVFDWVAKALLEIHQEIR